MQSLMTVEPQSDSPVKKNINQTLFFFKQNQLWRLAHDCVPEHSHAVHWKIKKEFIVKAN